VGEAGIPRSSTVPTMGGGKWYQKNILPRNFQETALQAHHNHTTASYRSVNKTLGTLRIRHFWQGLTAQVKRWVKVCYDCGAKKNWEKHGAHGAPMGRLTMDIPGPLPLKPCGNTFVLVVDYFTKRTESYVIPN